MEDKAKNNTGKDRQSASAPLWVIVTAAVVLVAVVGLLAWGLGSSAPQALQVGKPVPDFKLTTFDNQVIDTADLRGKVVLVNIWASWCGPCANEARYLEEAWQHFRDSGKVVFLGINWNDVEPKALDFLQRYEVTYPNGMDYENRINRIFRNTGVPETFILDPQGVLVSYTSGEFGSTEEIINLINPYVKK